MWVQEIATEHFGRCSSGIAPQFESRHATMESKIAFGRETGEAVTLGDLAHYLKWIGGDGEVLSEIGWGEETR